MHDIGTHIITQIQSMHMYFTCWELDVAAGELEVVAVMIPPVILKVVPPGLDRCVAVTVFTEPSDSFT